MPAVQGVLQQVRSPPPSAATLCRLARHAALHLPYAPRHLRVYPPAASRCEPRAASIAVCPAIAVCAQALGVEPSRTLNAEESVARGAALAAALQSPSFKVPG